MRSRDASGGGTAHTSCAPMSRMRLLRAREHVRMLRWLFNLFQVRKDCQLAITATLQVIATAILLLKLLLARY
jgi:hypothetical protein